MRMRILRWLWRGFNNLEGIIALGSAAGIGGIAVTILGRFFDFSGPLGVVLAVSLFLLLFSLAVPVTALGASWVARHGQASEQTLFVSNPAARFDTQIQESLDEFDAVARDIPRDPLISAREFTGHRERYNALAGAIERDIRRAGGPYAAKLYALDKNPQWPVTTWPQTCPGLAAFMESRRQSIAGLLGEYPITKQVYVRTWASTLIRSGRELRSRFGDGKPAQTPEDETTRLLARRGLMEWENDARILISQECSEFGHLFAQVSLDAMTDTELQAHIDGRIADMEEMWKAA